MVSGSVQPSWSPLPTLRTVIRYLRESVQSLWCVQLALGGFIMHRTLVLKTGKHSQPRSASHQDIKRVDGSVGRSGQFPLFPGDGHLGQYTERAW